MSLRWPKNGYYELSKLASGICTRAGAENVYGREVLETPMTQRREWAESQKRQESQPCPQHFRGTSPDVKTSAQSIRRSAGTHETTIK